MIISNFGQESSCHGHFIRTYAAMVDEGSIMEESWICDEKLSINRVFVVFEIKKNGYCNRKTNDM